MTFINRRDFVKTTMLSSALPFKVLATTKGGYRAPNQAERGIRVGCSTALWRYGAQASFSEALKGIAEAGYEWAEGSAEDLLAYEERTDELRELLERLGLGWMTATLRADLLDQKEGVRHVGRAVRTARLLRVMDADFLTIKGAWGDALEDPRGFRLVSKRLAEIGARVFEETGLWCAYHFQENDGTQVQKLIATSDSRYVKFCVDTLSLRQLGIDPLPMIRVYPWRVIHVHLHDAIKQNQHWHDVVIGQGQLRVGEVLNALCETHYDGWVTVEQEAIQHAAISDAVKSRKEVQSALTHLDLSGAKTSSFGTSSLPLQTASRGRSRFEAKRAVLHYFVTSAPTTLIAPMSLVPVSCEASKRQRRSRSPEATQAMHPDSSHSTVPLPPQDPGFKPLFFSEDEYRDVSALVDAIIPASETPGALDARADEFSDLIIWSDQREHDRVKAEVSRFRSLCLKRYRKAFSKLSSPEKDEFLTQITGASLEGDARAAASFFYRVRELTLHAYYTGSPQGLIQELGYKGNAYVTEFKGCTHPEHKG